MFPFGHRATLVTVIERVIEPDPVNASSYAGTYLGLKLYMRVTQPTKPYPAPGQPFGANDWPCTNVTITTPVSPPLDPSLTELTTVAPGTASGSTFDLAASPLPPYSVDAQALLLTSGGGIPKTTTTTAPITRSVRRLVLPFGSLLCGRVRRPG